MQLLPSENAGTAAGQASPGHMGKYGGDCHRRCNDAYIDEIPFAPLPSLGPGLRLIGLRRLVPELQLAF